MARPRKNPDEAPAPETSEFDVPPSAPDTAPPAIEDDEEPEEAAQDKPVPQAQAAESPEQRRLMREKRIAKAEDEKLRRLTRQFPVVARLVMENQTLKNKLATQK